jgi:DNA-binding response OmpR family regulator
VQLLVVEDDRDLRRFLSKAFREEGYAVAETESGDRAIDRALDGGYHCIILDVMLPAGTASA